MFPKRHDHIGTDNKFEAFREITYETVMEQFPEITAKQITLKDAFTAYS